jgi:hypothetical protein
MSKKVLITQIARNVNGVIRPFSIMFQGPNDLPAAGALDLESQMLIATSGNAPFERKDLKSRMAVKEAIAVKVATAEELASATDKFVDLAKPVDPKELFGWDVQLVVVENTTPDYVGHEPKVNPTTGEVCMNNGQRIYRRVKALPLLEGAAKLPHVLLPMDRPAAKPAVVAAQATS